MNFIFLLFGLSPEDICANKLLSRHEMYTAIRQWIYQGNTKEDLSDIY